MDYLKFVTDSNGTKGFSVEATTPDGLYTFRVFLQHSNQTASATATNNTTQVQLSDVQIIKIRDDLRWFSQLSIPKNNIPASSLKCLFI